MIRTVIVDDSRVVQEFLVHILSSDPDIQVVGVASSGHEAIDVVREKRPDVITMDIHMPGLDGYEATRVIMETMPTPIVIVSSSTGVVNVANSFKLFDAGALAVVLRPPDMTDPEFAAARKSLVQTVKLMSEIRVVRRFPNQARGRVRSPYVYKVSGSGDKDVRVIAIGASTGGPPVLKTILSGLPANLPVPVLIVQHIAKGFVQGFVNWLNGFSSIGVVIARDGDLLKPGIAYIAPDDYQMGVSGEGIISLNKNPPENGLCPSVDFLFRSVKLAFGPRAMGILLTGMGKDGALGLKAMKDAGAVTFAQDEASCVIFGMPGEAVRIGAVTQVLSPEKIVETISTMYINHE